MTPPPLTVGHLRAALADVPDNYVVTCSPGGGVLSAVTVTVNGAVILDAVPNQDIAERLMTSRGVL